MKVLLLLAGIMQSVNILAFPVVTDVQDPHFSGVADLSLREILTQMRQVDFDKYPELKTVYQKVIALTEKLLIEEDGTRPIRLVFEDDLVPNTFFLQTVKGDRGLIITLGMLRLLENDDQMAFVLGHELEHGLSVLNKKHNRGLPQSGYGRDNGNFMQLKFVNRVAENEVDVKSVFRRVHGNGMNPYAAHEVLEKLRQYGGDTVSFTHTMISNRINTVEQELTGMTRVIGERINQNNTTEVLNPSTRSFFQSDEFIQRRRNSIESIITGQEGKTDRFLDLVKGLESVPPNEMARAKSHIDEELGAILETFSSDKRRIVTELQGVVSDTDFLDYQLRLEGAFGQTLFEGIAQRFGDTVKVAIPEQFKIIQNLMREKLFTNPLMTGVTPLSSIDKEIDRKIHEQNRYGQGSDQGESSRYAAIERELRELRSKRRVLESGLENLPAAQRAEDALAGVGDINPRFWELRREFEGHIRYVGRWILRSDEVGKIMTLENDEMVFANPVGHGFLQAMNAYVNLSADRKREVFPQIFKKNIDYMIAQLQTTDDPVQQQSLLDITTKFLFGHSGTHIFKESGYGFEEYIADDAPGFTNHMRRLFRAVLDYAADDKIIPMFFGDQHRPELEYTLYDFFKSQAQGFYEQIVDEEMLVEATKAKFESFYRKLELNPQYENLKDLFAYLDQYFLRDMAKIRNPTQRQHLQERLSRVIGLVRRYLPEEFSGTLETIIKFRYFEASGLYNSRELAATLEQLFLTLERMKDNEAFRGFVAGTLNFDGVFQAYISARLKKKTWLGRIVDNAQFFTNSPRQILLIQGDDIAYVQRRKDIFRAFESKINIDGPNARGVFSILLNRADPHNLREVNYNYRVQEELCRRLLVNRTQYWFDKIGSEIPRRERVRLTLQNLFEETKDYWNKDMKEIHTALGHSDRGLTNIGFFFGYVDYIKEKDKREGHTSLTVASRNRLDDVYREIVGYLTTLEDVQHISDREKLELVRYKLDVGVTTPFLDMLVDYLFDIRDSDLEIRNFFDDEGLIDGLYYDSSKRKYAFYQLDQKHKARDIQRALESGEVAPPGVRQERRVVSEIQETLDKQFPINNHVKDSVLNHIEESIRTSQVETRRLSSSRVTLDNWHEIPELIVVDLPSQINSRLTSAYERKQLLEYLVGISDRTPEFIERIYGENDKETARTILANFRRRFFQSPPVARSMVIQPLFDKNIGLISEPEMLEEINKMILGEKYHEPIVKRLFEAYLQAVPETEQKVIYSYIMNSFVDSPLTSRGASLRVILEAMGPFGIKAGQFLNTSGLIPTEYSRELKDFLSNVLPPDRSRVIGDLEASLGLELRGLVSIGERLGSGSINYVQGVTVQVDGEKIDAVVRIRRDYIEGVVANENDIWIKVIQDLRSSEDPLEYNTADIVEEARKQALSTLTSEGAELDLSIERDNFADAQKTYGRRIRHGRLEGWEVRAAMPQEKLQRLVDPEKQKLFSFYERVNHTPLEQIQDMQLREEMAKVIIESELTALFENGVYDPDGHPGNWLVDFDKKAIVRIDYAQLRFVSEENRIAFKKVFSELIGFRPNFSTRNMAIQLATLLESERPEEELVAAIMSASEKTVLRSWGDPQAKLFSLRNAIQDELSGTFRAKVNLSDMLRSGLASLGKISGFAEHLSGSSYTGILIRYVDVPRYIVTVTDWRQMLTNTMNSIGNMFRFRSEDSQSIIRPEIELPESNSVIFERGVPSVADDNKTDVPSTTLSLENADERREYVTDIDFGDWKPETPSSIYRLTLEIYETLPDGTELYSTSSEKKYIKGVDYIVDETTKGKMFFGVRGADFMEGGGPKIADIIFGPPADMDLSQNPYYTNKLGLRIILLRPEELSLIPDGTVLFDTDGKKFVKETDDIGSRRIGDFLRVGFPDADQLGFEKFGVSIEARSEGPVNDLLQENGFRPDSDRTTTWECVPSVRMLLLPAES